MNIAINLPCDVADAGSVVAAITTICKNSIKQFINVRQKPETCVPIRRGKIGRRSLCAVFSDSFLFGFINCCDSKVLLCVDEICVLVPDVPSDAMG